MNKRNKNLTPRQKLSKDVTRLHKVLPNANNLERDPQLGSRSRLALQSMMKQSSKLYKVIHNGHYSQINNHLENLKEAQQMISEMKPYYKKTIKNRLNDITQDATEMHNTMKQQMNILHPVEHFGGFDEALINKNMIAFNIQPNVKDDAENPPYANFEGQGVDNRETQNIPLVNEAGAKELKTQIKQLDANIEHPQSDSEFFDEDGNDTIKADVKNKKYRLTEPNYPFGTLKNGDTIMDGINSEAMGDEGGHGHPELYQIERDNVSGDFMGNLDTDDDVDDNGLPADKEDIKDLQDGYKENPKDIDFAITNKTKPIINDEEMREDMQTGTPAIVGRELTKNTIGLSVMGANNQHNRNEISEIMKQYAPKYSRAYERNIKPFAKEMEQGQHTNMQTKILRSAGINSPKSNTNTHHQIKPRTSIKIPKNHRKLSHTQKHQFGMKHNGPTI